MRFTSSIFVVVLSAGIGLGQSRADGSAPSSSSSSGSSSAPGYIPFAGTSRGQDVANDSSNPNTPWLPVLINGETPSAAFSGELERGNLISGGLTVTSGYDDNALTKTDPATQHSTPTANTSFSFLPRLTWEQSRARSLFNFTYNPGFAVNQQLSELNSAAQNVALSSQIRLTEYVTWRLHDAFSSANNGATVSNSETAASVLHQPNQNVLTPLAKTVSNLSGTDLVYRMGAGTIVGGSGSYSLLSYSNLQGGPGVQLINSRSTGAEIFYQHRFLPKHWIGLTYAFQRLSFNGGVENTLSHSALLFDTIAIQPRLTLSLFGGATHSTTDGRAEIVGSETTTAFTPTLWSPNAGMTLGWDAERTGASATFSRRIDSGGGILGTVDRYSGTATVRRRFSLRWTGTMSFVYDNNRPLDRAEAGYRTVSGAAGIERRIGQQMAVAASYTRIHQSYGLVIPTQLFPDHNRALLSVNYFFSRPLGR